MYKNGEEADAQIKLKRITKIVLQQLHRWLRALWQVFWGDFLDGEYKVNNSMEMEDIFDIPQDDDAINKILRIRYRDFPKCGYDNFF